MLLKTSRFLVSQIEGDPVNWSPLILPVDCNYVGITNFGPSIMYFRSDSYDPNSELLITAGAGEVIGVTATSWPRFKEGTILGYIRFNSGTGPCIIKVVR